MQKATGVQIAILIFAVVFLSNPLRRYIGPMIDWDPRYQQTLGHLFAIIPAILILLLVPPLRAICVRELSAPIAPERRLEVVAVTLLKPLTAFAFAGGIVLWVWLDRGEMGLARYLGERPNTIVAWERATSWDGIVFSLVIAGLMGPVLEELVFRGMLYRAWAAQWGWFKAAVATSAVFAAYHPRPFAAFCDSLLFVALLRRTGTLWAPIVVHATWNISLWQPLLGQYWFRTVGKETGEIQLWSFHLAMLGLLAVALPVYLWMSRDRHDEPSPLEEVLAARP